MLWRVPVYLDGDIGNNSLGKDECLMHSVAKSESLISGAWEPSGPLTITTICNFLTGQIELGSLFANLRSRYKGIWPQSRDLA